MAATLEWFYTKGAGPSTVDISSGGGTQIRWKTKDELDIIDALFPMIKPTAGLNHSFWGHFHIQATVIPVAEIMNNFKLYSDGAGQFGVGANLFVSNNDLSNTLAAQNAQYIEATGVEDDSGDDMDTAAHPNVSGKTDVNNFITSSPRAITVSELLSALRAVGERTNQIVMQLTVTTSVDAEIKSPTTMAGRYDETL